jgi:hypothetical protein
MQPDLVQHPGKINHATGFFVKTLWCLVIHKMLKSLQTAGQATDGSGDEPRSQNCQRRFAPATGWASA